MCLSFFVLLCEIYNIHTPIIRQARRKAWFHAIAAIGDSDKLELQLKRIFNKILFPSMTNGKYKDYENVKYKSDEVATTFEWDSVHQDMRNMSFNVIFGSLFGIDKHLSRDNELFIQFSKCLQTWTGHIPICLLPRFLSLDKYFPWLAKSIDKLLKVDTKFHHVYEKQFNMLNDSYIKNAIKEHENHINSDNKTLFDEIYQTAKQEMNMKELIADIIVLFSGGTETTATTMEVSLIQLAKNQTMQQQIYQEIVALCGDRFESLLNNSDDDHDSDATNNEKEHVQFKKSKFDFRQCVKFNAFIHEVLRWITLGPVAIPRCLSKDCLIKFDINKENNKCCNILVEPCASLGKNSNSKKTKKESQKREFEYKIEGCGDSIVQANFLYLMRHNTNVWSDNPTKFDINRWIIDGKFCKKQESVPFGVGRRDCVGRMIAMKEITYMLALLILKFEFCLKDENQEIKMRFGLSREVAENVPLVVKHRSN